MEGDGYNNKREDCMIMIRKEDTIYFDDRKSLTNQVRQLDAKHEEDFTKVRKILNEYVNKIETLTTDLRNNKELLENRNNEIKSLKNNYNNNKIRQTLATINLKKN